jgi:hypothetical protein
MGEIYAFAGHGPTAFLLATGRNNFSERKILRHFFHENTLALHTHKETSEDAVTNALTYSYAFFNPLKANAPFPCNQDISVPFPQALCK